MNYTHIENNPFTQVEKGVQHGARHEIKYVLTRAEYLVLQHRLKKILKTDSHANEAGYYQVTSLYFDDLNNSALNEKLEGCMKRQKYRLRYYNSDLNHIKLEKKSKINTMTQKITLSLSESQSKAIVAGDYECLKSINHPTAQSFYHDLLSHRLVPKGLVRYQRESYMHPLGQTRITFDHNIEICPMDKGITLTSFPFVPSAVGDEIIMEVKFNHYLPDTLRCLLETAHRQSEAASKYVLSRRYNAWL